MTGPASPESLPTNRCSARFCGREGPSTKRQVVVRGAAARGIVGWCDVCLRWVCGSCGVWERLEASGSSALACCFCGAALGRGPYTFSADEVGAGAAREGFPIAAWAGLLREALRRGAIRSAGAATAHRALVADLHDEALRLATAELSACQDAGWDAGVAAASHMAGAACAALGRGAEAFDHFSAAVSYFRSAGDPYTLGRSLLGRATSAGFEALPPEDQLRDLEELQRLVGPANEAVAEHCVHQRCRIHLGRGDFAGALSVLVETANAVERIEALRVALSGQLTASGRANPPVISPTTELDEKAISMMRRGGMAIWGCPKGCRPPGTIGLVGLPRGQSAAGLPCPMCGTNYARLDRYSRLALSVPDRGEPSMLDAASLPPAARRGAAVASHALLLDASDPEVAAKVLALAVKTWERDMADDPALHAACLNLLARAVQDRDDHSTGLALCRAALELAESVDPPDVSAQSSYRNNAGLSLACLGEYDEAITLLQSALMHGGGAPNPWYWLAKVYEFRRNDGDAARERESWIAYLAAGSTNAARIAEARCRLSASEA